MRLEAQAITACLEKWCAPAGLRVRKVIMPPHEGLYLVTKRGRVKLKRTKRWRKVEYAGTVVIPAGTGASEVTTLASALVGSFLTVLAPLEEGVWKHRGRRHAITAVKWDTECSRGGEAGAGDGAVQ